ncbi:MAG TPA: ATP-binding protein [Sedimentisphaerales bacterium]|nr:ATP-binding protein [Sedimentisphaerales bacterium]
MKLSLRKRLIWDIVIGTTILLAIFSLIIYTVTKRTMIHHFNKSLLASAKMLSAVIEEDDEDGGDNKSLKRKIDFEFDVSMIPEFNNVNGGAYFQIWSLDGQILVRSPSLDEKNLANFNKDSQIFEYRECVLPDGKAGRSITYSFLPRLEDEPDKDMIKEGRELVLTVAKEAGELYGHLHFLKWLLFISSIIIIFMSTGLAYFVTHIILTPVCVLAKKIESIREDNFERRFPLTEFPAELHPICEGMDNLLSRLKASFEHERRFNKNVAHELRTPLAGLQTTIEVCLSRERGKDEYQKYLGECLGIVLTMNKLIDTLLCLSKLESGQISMQKESINVKGLIDNHWRYFGDLAYDKEIAFENAILEDLVCESDKDRLGMIISNLLDNAVEYCNRGGRIWAKAKQVEGVVEICISNTGSIITQEEVVHIFELFWRKDQSRTDTDRHSGIGLSVVRKVSDALGIEVKAEIKKDGIFTILLYLPNTCGHGCI